MLTSRSSRLALACAAAVGLAVPGASAAAQRGARDRAAAPARDTSSIPVAATGAPDDHETRVTTQHTAVIGGQRIAYEATVGNIVLRDTANQPIATIFYTAYTRKGISDLTHRPIAFAYNGGPGSSSIWVHMGAFGPRRVAVPDTAFAGAPPYPLVDNQYSILDKTDLVFIDPVGTGFSKPLGKAKGRDFWGVDEDARSLAQFVSRYLSESGRWNSPRYLIGESYGTTRSAALVNYLQTRDDADFNGVVLMSSVLDFQTIAFDPGNDMPYIMYLPSYAAVAAFYHALPQQPADLRAFLHRAEHFATTEYAQALLAAGKIDPAERARVIDSLHYYTGLDTSYIDKADLRVDNSQFEKELMREHGLVVGRLDARFTGYSGDLLAERAGYDPQSAAISSAYVSLFNTYLHDELNFPRDRQYVVSGNVNPWNWSHGRSFGWPGHTNVAVDLAEALQYNPHLHVLLNSGLYDLATPYFAAEWTMDHLGLPPAIRAHITEAEYDAGHMMYVHEPSLAKLKQNIAAFIDATSGPAATEAGKVAAGAGR